MRKLPSVVSGALAAYLELAASHVDGLDNGLYHSYSCTELQSL